jgi:(p)ppGpp synthase/HD superfamily hydrolase
LHAETHPKQERKKKQIEAAPTKSPRAKVLKLADKASNLRAVAASPARDWSVKRRIEYVRWCKEVIKGLRGANPVLEKLCDEAAQAAEQSFRPSM